MSANKSITVQVTGALKRHLATDATVHNVNTVGEAITELELPEIGELMLLVNGRMAYWDTPLDHGDIVKLVPAIGGGYQ